MFLVPIPATGGQHGTGIGDFDPLSGDVLDLSAIDAIAGTVANEAFTYIGRSGFDGTPGQVLWDFWGAREVPELPFQYIPEGWRVAADLDGDQLSDLSILLRAAPGSLGLYDAPFQPEWLVL